MVSFSRLGHSPSDESDPWVILRTVPRVHAHDGDLSFEIADPPHLSSLSVSTRVSPAPLSPPAPRATSSVNRDRDPRIISADLSASLFLTITPKPHPTATDPCCFVLDAASSSAHRIPDPARGFTPFGVIAAPDRASFVVVGYDIFKNVVLGYARHGMDVSSSSSLLAWKLPPALAVAAPAARRYGKRPNNCNGGASSGKSRLRTAGRVED